MCRTQTSAHVRSCACLDTWRCLCRVEIEERFKPPSFQGKYRMAVLADVAGLAHFLTKLFVKASRFF